MEQYFLHSDNSAGPTEISAKATVNGVHASQLVGELHPGGVFYLGHLETEPQFRRLGVASRLIDHTIRSLQLKRIEVTPISPASEALFRNLARTQSPVEILVV